MEYFSFQWHITDECDQRCKHCYIFSENNCNPADLEHGRIYDRIMERCVPVAFSGKNYRIGRGRTNMENASGILKHETV